MLVDKVLLVCFLTLIIHAIETLAYAVRLAGIKIGRLAVSLSLTGIIVLVSRTSNLIQAPMTGKLIDYAKRHPGVDLEMQFRVILLSSSIGTLTAMLLFPSVVSLSVRLISHLEVAGSIPQMIKNTATIGKLKRVKAFIRIPRWTMLSRLRIGGVPKRLLIFNCLVTAVYTVGVLAALYASFLTPAYSIAASQSSGLINGLATVILTIFIDPQVALLTDKTIRGETDLSAIQKVFGLLMLTRFIGTLLAQLLFIPAAYWIKWVVPLW